MASLQQRDRCANSTPRTLWSIEYAPGWPALRLPEDQIDTIRYVGLLHDVGKVGIRDAVMKKQGAYTLDEYEEMKNHANLGADMLAGLKFLGKGQDWVRYHHERWDGHGFPKGLSGEVYRSSPIMACADSLTR